MAVADITSLLRDDFPWWAENCAHIINTAGQLVPLHPKPAQLRIEQAAQDQRDAGKPVRLIVPKARKEGVSTYATGKIVQRITQIANHNAIHVAQDVETAAELLQMATLMHANLPDSPAVKPPIANRIRKKELVFGEQSRNAQAAGTLGINSRLRVDTASEFEAGRGFTFHSVHGSECAFWPDLKRKLTALLNAVPDEPETFVILESTSNGHNHWRTLCMQAQDGLNDFALVFLAWFEEPQYVRPFLSVEERGEFIDSIGTGPYGQQEPFLVEKFDVTPEQLHWRRWAIANRCQGDLRVWSQEYPSTLEESFGSTGRQVFSSEHVAKARQEVEQHPAAERGTLTAKSHRAVRLRHGTIEVPENPEWAVENGPWTVWQPPTDEGRYVIGVDPAGDEVMDEHERAMHGVVVIDHRTRQQCAELQAQGDADLIGIQVYLAAVYYNRAWVAIETTGGWGLSMARRIFKDFHYPFVYKRKSLQAGKELTEERLGFDTNRVSKVILEDGAKELLREGTHGIRSKTMIREMATYVKDQRGRSGPAPGERSDLLMAWMIAQQVAMEVTPRAGRSGGGVINTSTRGIINERIGW